MSSAAASTPPPPSRSSASGRLAIVGGNWKMNTDRAGATALADRLAADLASVAGVEVVVFPPFPYLVAVGERLRAAASSIRLGAQDFYHEPNGAFTGEVSLDMLADCGVSFLLIGHSERRHIIGESDELLNKKTLAALDPKRTTPSGGGGGGGGGGFSVIFCVGETLGQREAGQTDAVNERQLRAGLRGVTAEQMARVVIAYEPVWAIGTGKTATPDDARHAHAHIRRVLADLFGPSIADRTRIQYGGSVKASNAAELFTQPGVDGGLIGGASLKADEFVGIVRAAVRDAR